MGNIEEPTPKRTLTIIIEEYKEEGESESTFIADCLEANIYGTGNTPLQAIDDLSIAAIECLCFNDEEEKKMSPPLKNEYEVIKWLVRGNNSTP